MYVRRGLETHCTVPTRSYDRVKQLALNLHMQPQEFTLGEPLTIMRFYDVSFEGNGQSPTMGFFPQCSTEGQGESIIAVYMRPLYVIQSK